MKNVIATEKAPAAIGPYSQGIRAGSLIITSGQLPIDMATGAFPATIEEQTRKSLENCKAVLEASGATMENVIKTTVFLSDMNNFAAMNGVYATFFAGDYPARSAVEVAASPRTRSLRSSASPSFNFFRRSDTVRQAPAASCLRRPGYLQNKRRNASTLWRSVL